MIVIRYIAGLCTMNAAKEVYVRDCEGATAKLFVGCNEVLLTPQEMDHLAECIGDAAERARLRAFNSAPETPEEPKDAE